MSKQLPRGWQKVRLGDICDINVNSLKENTNKNYQFKYIDLSSVKNGIIDFPNNYITFKNAPSRARRIIKIDDVIMATVRPNLKGFAYISFDPKEYICSTGFAVLTSKSEICMKYIYQILYANYIEKQISNMLVGSNYPALNTSDILNIKILLPPIDEQKRIAEVLSLCDDLIENLTKLIEKKEIYKKGVMQRVLTGKVRFNGFTDEWETVRLGDMVEMSSGGTPNTKNKEYYNGNIVWVTIKDITTSNKFLYDSEKKITKKGLENSSAKIFPINTILYAMYASIGECIISKVECATSQAILGIECSNRINFMFLYYLLLNNKNNAKKMRQTGTQPNLNKQIVSDFEFNIPSLEEQNKIAELLTLIDQDIDNLKQLLHLRKLQKKGLMQKLLTGEVRI